MDKLNDYEKSEGKKRKKTSLSSRINEAVKTAIDARRHDKVKTATDLLFLLLGLLFSRCHIIFGSHPLGIALLAILPGRVWVTLFGCIIGTLTLGKGGLVYAMISLIVVFLRVIVSSTDKKEAKGELFSEHLLLRMSAALIGGFVSAVYEILISGFSMTTVLFGTSMVLLPPILSFAFSGLFDTVADFSGGIFTDKPVFSLKDKSDGERAEAIFFQISALFLIFFLSLSLSEYIVFGINISYIFAGGVTLLVSKRFGALRAGAVGFISTLGLSSVYSVGFALLGLSAGVLFSFGTVYSLIAGGIALFAWCTYSGGISGVLSTLPEYAISSLLVLPVLKKLSKEQPSEIIESSEKSAADMLGTVALSFKSHYSGSIDALENSLSSISAVTRKYSERAGKPTREELSELIDKCISKYCMSCDGYTKCERCLYLSPESRERCITSLMFGEAINEDSLTKDKEKCHGASGIASSVCRAAAILQEEKYKAYQKDTSADELALMSKLISEARYSDECEKATNDTLTEEITKLLLKHDLKSGVARVYGSRAPHLIISCEDENGTKISSPALREDIEKALGTSLASPEYYKKGKMVLMECGSASKLSAECAITSRAGIREAISGDTARAFESKNGRFYTLISDGMGSGREAKETSELVADFLVGALEHSHAAEPILGILNNILRRRNTECSATVDMFSIDLISGTATFIKSGAAPSYIKRGSSLFRISSKTAPIGTVKTIDAERIKADVEDGDYVIMLSDGVSQNVEDTPWLPLLLSKPALDDLGDYAEMILRGAFENGAISDDMTVAVTKIKLIP